MKVAITGKGGVGKTTLSAILARLYADEGRTVLAADVDPDAIAEAAVRGMNFTWCGQSCGSTSRLYVPRSLHDEFMQLEGFAINLVAIAIVDQHAESHTFACVILNHVAREATHAVDIARFGANFVADLDVCKATLESPGTNRR